MGSNFLSNRCSIPLKPILFGILLLFSTSANAWWFESSFPVEIDSKTLSEGLKRDFLSSHRYDSKIRKETERWFPNADWRLIKAQFYQESKFNPEAKSSVGAEGISQFMPGTWNQISNELGIEASPTNPDYSIMAGVYYDAKLYKYWTSERPELHRMAFMLGSYNAGIGNILEAQKTCNKNINENCNLYPPVINNLHHVTGHHSKETKKYVENIFNFYVLDLIN